MAQLEQASALQQRPAEARKSWREKNPEVSGAIPWVSSLAWGAVPYLNRMPAQGVANDFNLEAAANVARGKAALLSDPPDLIGGRIALDQANQALNLRQREVWRSPTIFRGMCQQASARLHQRFPKTST
jgi:hypothetical protein